MHTHWRNSIAKTVFWLITEALLEVLLNVTGLDNLADYSEFIFEHLPETTASYPTEVQTLPHSPCKTAFQRLSSVS